MLIIGNYPAENVSTKRSSKSDLNFDFLCCVRSRLTWYDDWNIASCTNELTDLPLKLTEFYLFFSARMQHSGHG